MLKFCVNYSFVAASVLNLRDKDIVVRERIIKAKKTLKNIDKAIKYKVPE